MEFKFNDGSTTEGELIAKAMNVLIIKTEDGHFMINRNALDSEDPYALVQE